MESESTTKICGSTSIVVVIIHTKKFQLRWMFETEIRWVGHFCPPWGTSYPSTNRFMNTYFAEPLWAAAPIVIRDLSSSSSNQMFIYLRMHLFISQS